MQVRDAVPSDAQACADVYAPYVEGTAITFELVPPTAAEMAERIAAAQRAQPGWWPRSTDASSATPAAAR